MIRSFIPRLDILPPAQRQVWLAVSPDAAVDYCSSRHSRMLQAGIQKARNAWMPASAGMTPLFRETVSSSHLARVLIAHS